MLQNSRWLAMRGPVLVGEWVSCHWLCFGLKLAVEREISRSSKAPESLDPACRLPKK